MKKTVAPLIAFAIIPALAYGQTSAKIANNAFVITRMVNKFNLDPRPVDDAFSTLVFDGTLSKTDGDKALFTQTDITRLSA